MIAAVELHAKLTTDQSMSLLLTMFIKAITDTGIAITITATKNVIVRYGFQVKMVSKEITGNVPIKYLTMLRNIFSLNSN